MSEQSGSGSSLISGNGTSETGTGTDTTQGGTATDTVQVATGTDTTTGATGTDTVEAVAAEPLTAEAITLPDGFTPNEPVMTEFLGIMNNAEASPKERAQSLIDLYAKVQQEASEKGSQLWNETQTKWQEDTRKDPEVGGAKLEPALAGISKLIDAYAPNPREMREVFEVTGAGNHPLMVKFLNKIAHKLVVEGGPANGGPPARNASGGLETIYDHPSNNRG